MLPIQKAAVDQNLVEIVEALEGETPAFLNYLEQRSVISVAEREFIVSGCSFSAQMLTKFLHILKAKDDGLLYLINYLRANGKYTLADKLQNDASEETGETVAKKSKLSALVKFSFNLAQYYKLNYADVPTMGESTKHVEDVWVPLQIDGRREAHLKEDRIDHIELLNRLKSDERRNVALIKGDPGMGKTTLAKKIAYDWAVDYSSYSYPQFSLVLAVPLRSAGKSTLFDQLAIDYFCSIGGGQLVKDINKEELIDYINKLGSQLLVILDGLDEYADYSESSFKDMFAGPFQHSSAYSKVTLPTTNFKLIITSRPYACEDVQMAFPLLRFVILPLDADHLSSFIQFYCETTHGADSVTEYLKTNSKVVIKVPLILTFICYLADSYKEIPTNMTSLYDSFIRQMLRRENRQEKLAESIDIQSWKNSNMIKTSSKLAYGGSTDILGKYEFSKSDLGKCHVTNDSFICGFLLHKFNFTQDILMAEFPHRSIQEFFATLHCYKVMLTGHKDVLIEVNSVIVSRDSLVGRFFFGICSNERRFDQMTDWLRPSLFPSEKGTFQPSAVITAFNSALADCSSEKNFIVGRKLFDSVVDLGDNDKEYLIGGDYWLRSDQFSDDFKKGLHLRVLYKDERGLTTDWFLADNLKLARFVFAQHRLQQLLEEKFDQIDVLILGYGEIDRSASFQSVKHSRTQTQSDSQNLTDILFHQIQQLPPKFL